jgi:hypothetical protein
LKRASLSLKPRRMLARGAADAHVTAPPTFDATADAVAARVAAINDARSKADAMIAVEAKAPSDEMLSARASAQAKLDDAIARGHLRPQDVLAIRDSLAADVEGRAELARQISVAMNQGRLVPDDPHRLVP